MDEKFGLEREQEALAAFDKIRAEFAASSPTEDLDAVAAETPEKEVGHGLGDGYADDIPLKGEEAIAALFKASEDAEPAALRHESG